MHPKRVSVVGMFLWGRFAQGSNLPFLPQKKNSMGRQTWWSKFGNKSRPVIDGCCDEKSIADQFASVFQSVCVPNTVERHQQLLDEFTQRFDTSGHNFGNDIISVELVEQCIM